MSRIIWTLTSLRKSTMAPWAAYLKYVLDKSSRKKCPSFIFDAEEHIFETSEVIVFEPPTINAGKL